MRTATGVHDTKLKTVLMERLKCDIHIITQSTAMHCISTLMHVPHRAQHTHKAPRGRGLSRAGLTRKGPRGERDLNGRQRRKSGERGHLARSVHGQASAADPGKCVLRTMLHGGEQNEHKDTPFRAQDGDGKQHTQNSGAGAERCPYSACHHGTRAVHNLVLVDGRRAVGVRVRSGSHLRNRSHSVGQQHTTIYFMKQGTVESEGVLHNVFLGLALARAHRFVRP